MRINYIHKEEDSIKGYENIHINHVSIAGDSLYGKCEDAEAKEIRAEYILEKFDFSKIGNILDYWLKKLRLNGKLVIIGTELYTLAKSIVTRNLGTQEINQALYAGDKKSLLSIFTLEDMLLSRGFKIVQKRIDGFTYCIIAERVK